MAEAPVEEFLDVLTNTGQHTGISKPRRSQCASCLGRVGSQPLPNCCSAYSNACKGNAVESCDLVPCVPHTHVTKSAVCVRNALEPSNDDFGISQKIQFHDRSLQNNIYESAGCQDLCPII